MKQINIYLAAIAMLSSISFCSIAAETSINDTIKYSNIYSEPSQTIFDEKVIVGNDTVSMIIPEKNLGRYNRGLYNFLFIPKGDWVFGLNASYGEFNADDVEVLSILKNLDFGGKIYSIKPSASYFFKNNQSIGLRLNFTNGEARIDNLAIDFDEDLNFSINNVSYSAKSYGASIFYRNYIGLSNLKRFAIFNETELSYSGGSSSFKRYYNGVLSDTHTTINEAKLSFSPGVCVFIHEYVSFNVSFGVLGLYFRNEDQKTNGIDEGSRFSSGANFKFNLFNINFGLGINI